MRGGIKERLLAWVRRIRNAVGPDPNEGRARALLEGDEDGQGGLVFFKGGMAAWIVVTIFKRSSGYELSVEENRFPIRRGEERKTSNASYSVTETDFHGLIAALDALGFWWVERSHNGGLIDGIYYGIGRRGASGIRYLSIDNPVEGTPYAAMVDEIERFIAEHTKGDAGPA